MDDSWATFGIDLHLELRGPRRRRALEEALRRAVADGRLAAGTRLPSSRSLAADLGLARNTVVDAYAQLVAEGWLAARHGSGTTVAARPPVPDQAETQAPDGPRPWRYDLRPGRPDLSSFPRSAWLAAARRTWSYAPDADFGYGDPRGTRQLREALAGYLGRARGVRSAPSRIVICSGFTQAFGLLGQVLRKREASTVAVEPYGLPELGRIAAVAGLGIAPMPLDKEGADVASVEGAGAALVTPAHQFPLGTVLSPGRRHAALAWAHRQSAVIVEDDYDGEFRYDREPLGALQGLDPERVVYVGTASKTLAPALRLAWMALPADLVEPVSEAKLLADHHTPTLDQLTLAEFIRSGAYDRHVRARRLAYRRRRDRLVEALPAGRVSGISAGLHALVHLPAPMTEAEAVSAAAAGGLALEGLDSYRTGPDIHHPPAIVVGYATPPEHAYRAALTRLGDVLAARAPSSA
ncbi:MAG TPA: PLP-dependent aminotransferase family protein [Acidimicrobiales bacterium]|nr:PLP-dependent aminotransferase family protein [Acidimicrobiales bacterium]